MYMMGILSLQLQLTRVEKDILIESYYYIVKYLSYLQFISSVFLTRNELSALVLYFLRLLLLFKLTLFRGAKKRPLMGCA